MTDAEIVATAFVHPDAKTRKKAMKQMKEEVDGAPDIKRALGTLAGKLEYEVTARLRTLDHPERTAIALAMTKIAEVGFTIAFEESPEFAAAFVHKLADKRKLDLAMYHKPKRITSLDLRLIPDVVFDEIPKIRKKKPFHTVSLHGCELTDLPARFAELAPFLKVLNLSYNPITTIPSVVFELENLEELQLDCFDLVDFPDELTSLRKLTHLVIGHNKKLRKLPPIICKLDQVKKLNLRFTKMSTLPKEISGMTSLEQLHLQSSKLRTLPKELADLPNLKKVNIRFASYLTKAQAKEAAGKGVRIEP